MYNVYILLGENVCLDMSHYTSSKPYAEQFHPSKKIINDSLTWLIVHKLLPCLSDKVTF